MFGKAIKIAKASGKIMIRGKAFLAIGLLFPIISTLLINLWASLPVADAKTEEVFVLDSPDVRLAYMVDFNRFPVKVYDTAGTGEALKICEKLNESRLFQLFLTDVSSLSSEEVKESASRSALEDKVGAILIIREPLEDSELYAVGEDERFGLLKQVLPFALTDYEEINSEPRLTFLSVNTEDEVNFSAVRGFSYSTAIASIAFIFGGVLVLSTIISEKKDHVFSRLLLTGAGRSSYYISKLLLSIGLALFQSLLMTVCFGLFVKVDIIVTLPEFFTILFMLGTVFNLLSLCVGLFCNSVAAASIAAFCIWSISALLAGSYFDIASAGETYKKIALLMPQRWAMLSVTKFSHGDFSGYTLICCATLAYIVIIFAVGLLGLKIGEEE